MFRICIIIFIVFFLFMLLFKNRKLLLPTIFSLFILLLILNPRDSINSCINGAKLFFFSVFPSIFPFIVFCNMLIAYNGIYFYSKFLGKILCKPLKLSKNSSIVLLISALCGYPLGAKYSCDLLEKKAISYNECERLLNIASNPSPLFITGTIGVVLLNSNISGIIILLSTYISCIVMGIILPSNNNNFIENNINTYKIYNIKSFGKILKESINEAIITCGSIMGFIIIFSVITDIIKSSIVLNTAVRFISSIIKVPQDIIFSTIVGSIEMTNGCKFVSSTSSSLILKITLISFLTCFSGFSIIAQVYSFTSKFNFPLKKYVGRKLIQALLCAVISFIISCFLIL